MSKASCNRITMMINNVLPKNEFLLDNFYRKKKSRMQNLGVGYKKIHVLI